MWGKYRVGNDVRPWAGALMMLWLVGCASHQAVSQSSPPQPAPTEGRDATGAYRFNMTQHGRRMSADEFDAWMKARGIRVAKGASSDSRQPATHVAATAARKSATGRPSDTPRRATAAAATVRQRGSAAATPPALVVTAAKPPAAAPAAGGKAKPAPRSKRAEVVGLGEAPAKAPKRGEG